MREKSDEFLVEAEQSNGVEKECMALPIEADELTGKTVVLEIGDPIFQSKSGLEDIVLLVSVRRPKHGGLAF